MWNAPCTLAAGLVWELDRHHKNILPPGYDRAMLSFLTSPAVQSAQRGLRLAAHRTGAVWLGMFALGLGLGVLVTSNGLPWWLAPILSGGVYAGSVEFLLVGMMVASAPLSAIALTTLLVNARHVFYGLSFPLQQVRGRWRRFYSMYALTDEAYVLIANLPAQAQTSRQMLWIQVGLHLSWVSGSVLGALVGAAWLRDVAGLDFVLTALFIVLAIDAYRTRPDKTIALAALGAGGAAAVLAGDAMLLVALAAFVVFCLGRHAVVQRAAAAQGGRHGA